MLTPALLVLAACSPGHDSASGTSLHAVAATRAPNGSGAASIAPDLDREVPDGTLTWKVVFTSHQSEANVKGPDVDIARSKTDVRWVTNGRAKLTSSTGSGALTRSGDTQDTAASPPPGSDPLAAIARECGDDQACQIAAMVKLRNDPKAMAALQARQQAASAFVDRLDEWVNDGPDESDLCHLATDGAETSDWNGGARFTGSRGIVTIAFSAHGEIKGRQRLDCNAEHNLGIMMRADPVVKVYDLTLPAVTVKTSHETRFTTDGPGPNATIHATENIDLPSVTVKGQPEPAP